MLLLLSNGAVSLGTPVGPTAFDSICEASTATPTEFDSISEAYGNAEFDSISEAY